MDARFGQPVLAMFHFFALWMRIRLHNGMPQPTLESSSLLAPSREWPLNIMLSSDFEKDSTLRIPFPPELRNARCFMWSIQFLVSVVGTRSRGRRILTLISAAKVRLAAIYRETFFIDQILPRLAFLCKWRCILAFFSIFFFLDNTTNAMIVLKTSQNVGRNRWTSLSYRELRNCTVLNTGISESNSAGDTRARTTAQAQKSPLCKVLHCYNAPFPYESVLKGAAVHDGTDCTDLKG